MYVCINKCNCLNVYIYEYVTCPLPPSQTKISSSTLGAGDHGMLDLHLNKRSSAILGMKVIDYVSWVTCCI